MYQQALRIVRVNNRVSIAMIQRVLNIGYNRACSMVEAMESDGFVSARDYRGDRKLLPAIKETP